MRGAVLEEPQGVEVVGKGSDGCVTGAFWLLPALACVGVQAVWAFPAFLFLGVDASVVFWLPLP